MKDNTILASDGSEVYADKILMYADAFIMQELEEERRQAIYTNNSIFTAMLFYIADNINKPDNNDIQLLDNIFNIYIRLCTKYDKLPTLERFCILININPGTLSDWSSGVVRNNIYYDSKGNYINDFPAWRLNHKDEPYRVEPSTAHSEAVKKWKNICKNFLVDSLQNSKGVDANKIFIAKAAYGMVETAPVPVQNAEQHRTAEQIAADYGPQPALHGEVVPDF